MNKPKTEHSPLPWKFILRNTGEEFQLVDAKGLWIGSIDRHSCGKPLAAVNELNAEFIVLACNNHDRLVEALDPDMLEAIADEIDGHQHSARAHSLRVIAAHQRQALSSAKG